MMTVGRIAYTNTEPFFHFWNNEEFPLNSSVPRALARAAKEGDVIAGPLPIVECWNLENEFTPLGNWGIAAKERCRSVFVFSHRPFRELNNMTIGLTRESATSVALCSVLISQKYGHTVQMRRGFTAHDDARLVIGDQALEMGYSPVKSAEWKYVTDLATEWWNWQSLPFVFAQWVVRKSIEPAVRSRLSKYVQYCFNRGVAALPDIAEQEAKRLKLQPELVLEYLKGFMYQFSPEAEKSMLVFREMVRESSLDLAGAIK